MLRSTLLAVLLSTAISSVTGQVQPEPPALPPPPQTGTTPATKKWYDVMSLGGYTQIRYNRLLETNPDLGCEQCDKSWGGDNNVFIRRGRLRFSGYVTKRIFFYIQPDFASGVSSNLNFTMLRDAYFDVGLDKKNEFRFRIGESKVPYSFENLQSSQNRLPLDRNDALNSAAPNERDLGVFFYYAPAKIRERFDYLIKSGLRGSGDYGVFGLGFHNGQTLNKPEANDNLHVAARLTYPFQLKNGQIIEAGIQGYSGQFVLLSTSKDVLGTPGFEYTDQRLAASLVVYPQPFGFQAEYNIGNGPRYNPALNTIEESNLHGGYVLAQYRTKIKDHALTPFVRYQYFDGGKKHELDARSYEVSDLEIGLEWQPVKAMEINCTYTISDRTYEDAANRDNHQKGNLLRIQVQFNY
jgi:hypothetical protein